MNKPRILNLILMLPLILLLFSTCHDDSTGPGADSIVGVWKRDSVTLFVFKIDSVILFVRSLTNPDSTVIVALSSDFTVNIKADNTWTGRVVGESDEGGTWSVGGNIITFTEADGGIAGTFEFSISGNTLTMTDSITVNENIVFQETTYTRQ